MKQFNSLILLLFYALFLGIRGQATGSCATNASGNVGSCLCNQGYYGSSAEVGGLCIQCPTGTTTSAPSNSSSGNTNSGVDISICSSCQVNYYMTASSSSSTSPPVAATCLICPNNTGNSGATTVGDLSQCNSCLANFYMSAAAVIAVGTVQANSATCVACPSGSSNTGVTSVGNLSQCGSCSPGFYMSSTSNSSSQSAAACTLCPKGTLNTGVTQIGNVSQCNICHGRYYMTAEATSSAAAQCSACPSFSYSTSSTSVGSIASCTCYDVHAATLSSKVTSCACAPGYQGLASTLKGVSTCQACGPWTFSIGGYECKLCATGSTISANQGSCKCNDSSKGTLAWNSSYNICECDNNYYGSPSAVKLGGTGSCTPCPQGTSSIAGAQSVTECISLVTTNVTASFILITSLVFSIFISILL